MAPESRQRALATGGREESERLGLAGVDAKLDGGPSVVLGVDGGYLGGPSEAAKLL
jgi:hypothetical protein